MRLHPPMSGWILGTLLTCAAGSTLAAPSEPPPAAISQPTAHLSATASTLVKHDWLIIRLSTQKDGADAALVQRQLKATLAAALAQAQTEAKAQAMEVSTGQIHVTANYNRDGNKITGWIGTAELVLQGRDTDRITAMAGRLNGLTISHVDWQLSPELLTATEASVQGQAVAQWRAKASALTQQLGMNRYSIDDITLSMQSDAHNTPRVQRMVGVASLAMQDSAPIPLQAGQANVTVGVTGKIRLE